MTPTDIYALLKPGDHLLYRPKGVFGWAIELRTWHGVAHCELYTGNGQSAASRDGVGVAIYPWRPSELAYVLRPTAALNWPAFWTWFRTVNGQKYDWAGLLRFIWFKQVGSGNNGKQFCSEFLYRADRALGAQVLSVVDDADAIAPFEFLLSPNLVEVATPATLGKT